MMKKLNTTAKIWFGILIIVCTSVLQAYPALAEEPLAFKFENMQPIRIGPYAAFTERSITQGEDDSGNLTSVFPSMPVELKEISMGLKGDTDEDFYRNVFYYVNQNIQTEFKYGLSKGGFGAFVDQSGTSFDQAELMALLLKAGGKSASVAYGRVELTEEQFARWTGLAYFDQSSASYHVDKESACRFLANGAIPTDLGVSSCDGLTGRLGNIVIVHAWVTVDTDNGKLIFDPSFREYELNDYEKRDEVLGCSSLQCNISTDLTSELLSAPAVVNRASNGDMRFARKLNRTAIEARLDQLALQFQSRIKVIDSSIEGISDLEEILGGRHKQAVEDVDPAREDYTGGTIVSTFGEYLYAPGQATSGLPNGLRSYINVAGKTIWVDEIYGTHWNLHDKGVRESSGDSGRGDIKVYRRSETGDISKITISIPASEGSNNLLKVGFPYGLQSTRKLRRDFNNYDYHDKLAGFRFYFNKRSPQLLPRETDDFSTTAIGMRTYIDGFSVPILLMGRATSARLNYYSELLNEIDAEDANLDASEIASSMYHYQYSLAQDVLESLTESRGQNHATVGWNYVYGKRQLELPYTQGFGGTIPWGEWEFSSQNLSLEHSYSTTNIRDNVAVSTGAKKALAFASSMIEASVLNQQSNTWMSGSPMSAFVYANKNDDAEFMSAKVAPSGGTLEEYLANWDRSPKWDGLIREGDRNTLRDLQKGIVRDYFNHFSESHGIITNESYQFVDKPEGLNDTQIRSRVVPFFTSSADENSISLINGGLKGAISTADTDLEALVTEIAPKSATIYSGVNISNGSVSLSPQADIVSGAGGFPFSLPFIRSYNSRNDRYANYSYMRSLDGAVFSNFVEDDRTQLLPKGWTHNYDVTASIGNNAARALGSENALDASRAIVALFALSELFEGAEPAENQMAAMFVTNWLEGHLINNSVNVNMGANTQSYFKLPDGSFNPENEDTNQIDVMNWPTKVDDLEKVQVAVFEGFENVFVTLKTLDGEEYKFGDPTGANPRDRDGYDGNGYSGRRFFTNKFYLTNISFPNGIDVTLDYEKIIFDGAPMSFGGAYQTLAERQRLKTVSNGLGRTLAFSYDNPGYSQNYGERGAVTDDTGRKVTFLGKSSAIQNYGAEYKAVLPDGSEYEYVFADVTASLTTNSDGYIHPNRTRQFAIGSIKELYYPIPVNEPIQIYEYDDLDRIRKITDASNQSQTYFIGSMGYEDRKFALQQDGLDNKTQTVFDEDGRPLMVIEPSYEGAGQ